MMFQVNEHYCWCCLMPMERETTLTWLTINIMCLGLLQHKVSAQLLASKKLDGVVNEQFEECLWEAK